MSKMTVTADAKPMLNAYPDSVGGTLSDIHRIFTETGIKGCIFFLLYSAQRI